LNKRQPRFIVFRTFFYKHR